MNIKPATDDDASPRLSTRTLSAGPANSSRQDPPRWWLWLILAAPSFYALCTLPPLWRDSDGFYQLTTKPSYLTLLHWPPLYCFGARIPLLLGNLATGTLPLRAHLGHQPLLTDPGIYTLLVAQHALLVIVLYRACRELAPRSPWQLGYAVCLALASPLYAFANCVGSEALSNVLTVWTALACWRVAQRPSGPTFVQTLGPLSLAILTRHINALFILILPIHFSLQLALAWWATRRQITRTTEPRRVWPAGLARPAALLGTSLLVGASAVAIASGCIAVLCHESRTPIVSRAGYAFQWRLDFLASLPPVTRAQILAKAERSLRDPVITVGLEAVRASLDAAQPFNPEALFSAMYQQLLTDGILDGQRRRDLVDQKLNRLAAWFLSSADPTFYRVVARDFATSLAFSPSQIAREPFAATDWLVDQAPRQHALAPLQMLHTFRQPPGAMVSTWQRRIYFRLWDFVPLWFLGITAILLGVAVYRRSPRPENFASLSYPLSLVVTALAMTWANCSLTFLGARFLLPAYLLFLLSAMAALHSVLQGCADRR